MPIIQTPMLTTRQFVLGLMVACLVVGAAVRTVSLGLPLLAARVFGFVVLVVLLVSLVRFVRLLLVAPKARQLYPGVPLVTGVLLFGLMTQDLRREHRPSSGAGTRRT
jgi:hypothetical protein